MAFQVNKLELLAGGGTVLNLWGYQTGDDAKEVVDTAGYFDIAHSILKPGDWVFVNASDGQGLAVVNSNSDGVVDVTDLLDVGSNDTR